MGWAAGWLVFDFVGFAALGMVYSFKSTKVDDSIGKRGVGGDICNSQFQRRCVVGPGATHIYRIVACDY